jgi:hypothetical protein
MLEKTGIDSFKCVVPRKVPKYIVWFDYFQLIVSGVVTMSTNFKIHQ